MNDSFFCQFNARLSTGVPRRWEQRRERARLCSKLSISKRKRTLLSLVFLLAVSPECAPPFLSLPRWLHSRGGAAATGGGCCCFDWTGGAQFATVTTSATIHPAATPPPLWLLAAGRKCLHCSFPWISSKFQSWFLFLSSSGPALILTHTPSVLSPLLPGSPSLHPHSSCAGSPSERSPCWSCRSFFNRDKCPLWDRRPLTSNYVTFKHIMLSNIDSINLEAMASRSTED